MRIVGGIFKVAKRKCWLVSLAAIVSATLLLEACGGDGGTSASTSTPGTPLPETVEGYARCAPGGTDSLSGAGATFPNPLYTKWNDEYNKLCDIEINYQSIGSGGGINNIIQKTVDFGASDGIMNADQKSAANAAGGPIMHIAMTSGSVAIIYNVPGVPSGQLKLDGPTLADIFLGNIKKWNDPKLTALNSGLSLPNADIAVVHRSDSSGTSFIFTDYLSNVSPAWQSGPGAATAVSWPTGLGGQGNEGVAGQVRQLPGAIGYTELAYAVQNNLAMAQMKNKSGNFVAPTLEATTAAAMGVTIPDDMEILLTDSSNPQAYPIVGFTWILAYTNQQDAAKGKTLAHYLWWAIHEGQAFTQALNYAPLSPEVVKAAEAEILSFTCAGTPCLTK